MRLKHVSHAIAIVVGGFVAAAGMWSTAGVSARAVVEVLASGLDNPRGLDFGPDGALYVVEAGRGGTGPCIENSAGAEVCLGPTGAITRIRRGIVRRIITGLPSLASASGEATGVHDISFNGRQGYVVLGLGADPAKRALLGPAGFPLDRLVQLSMDEEGGSPGVDFGAVERLRNPDGGPLDSNPYAVLALPQGQLVADAGGNAVYGVLGDDLLLTLGVFRDRPQALPFPFDVVAMLSVPNSLTHGPDGAVYVGELTGFPFPPGGANVYRLVPGRAPVVFRSGFTNIIDLDFGSDGSLYVLQFAAKGLLSGPPMSAIVRVRPNGTRSVVDVPGLFASTALVYRHGALYVSNNGTSVGGGEILRIMP
jgi:hypothetical protein